MVELDDFIAGALTSIAGGIQKARSDADVGSLVAPIIQGEKRNDHGNFHLKGDDTKQAMIVQFDVEVTAGQKTEGGPTGKFGFKLYVVNADIGGNVARAVSTSQVHRLKFAIPLQIPPA